MHTVFYRLIDDFLDRQEKLKNDSVLQYVGIFIYFYISLVEQKDEAFVASLESTVSGLASDKVKKADLPFTSKGDLPVSRETVFFEISFFSFFRHLIYLSIFLVN